MLSAICCALCQPTSTTPVARSPSVSGTSTKDGGAPSVSRIHAGGGLSFTTGGVSDAGAAAGTSTGTTAGISGVAIGPLRFAASAGVAASVAAPIGITAAAPGLCASGALRPESPAAVPGAAMVTESGGACRTRARMRLRLAVGSAAMPSAWRNPASRVSVCSSATGMQSSASGMTRLKRLASARVSSPNLSEPIPPSGARRAMRLPKSAMASRRVPWSVAVPVIASGVVSRRAFMNSSGSRAPERSRRLSSSGVIPNRPR
ncbi:MAG: hypothetical protein C0502_04385 [Opitutus sp.]|nr:hypothetical protein [Opitutus sp.]